MTDRQTAVLLVLSDRTGLVTTSELVAFVNGVSNDEDMPEIPSLSTSQVLAVGQQLSRRGFVTEDSYLTAEKRWAITEEGRRKADSARGLVD